MEWGYRVVFALLIINKAGGLIFQRDFAEGLNKLSVNDYLVLAGTFHGYETPPLLLSRRQSTYIALTVSRIHAISTRLNPLQAQASSAAGNRLSSSSVSPNDRPDPPSGIEVLEAENFRLTCFQTQTGTKFLLFTDPQQPNVDATIRKIYELYADYVMKNPFYQMEMPVRCEGFERRLGVWIRGLNSR